MLVGYTIYKAQTDESVGGQDMVEIPTTKEAV